MSVSVLINDHVYDPKAADDGTCAFCDEHRARHAMTRESLQSILKDIISSSMATHKATDGVKR